jgi:hypothetical protein
MSADIIRLRPHHALRDTPLPFAPEQWVLIQAMLEAREREMEWRRRRKEIGARLDAVNAAERAQRREDKARRLEQRRAQRLAHGRGGGVASALR